MDRQNNGWTDKCTDRRTDDGPMDSKLPYRPIDRPTDADRQIKQPKRWTHGLTNRPMD